MKVIVADDYQEMSKIASEIITEEIIKKPNIVLGLATGTSPIGLYDNLIENYNNEIVDFSSVSTFNLDEYLGLNPENENSYSYFMWDKLFSHINVKKENVHLLKGDASDIQKEMNDYVKAIKECHGIDVQVLGIGSNGHIGFNEPGTDFEKLIDLVDLKESTINDNSRLFDNIEDVPKKAVSLGIKSIMNAKKIILLASGEKKQDAIYKTIHSEVTNEVPSTILNLHHDVTIIVDKKAAGKIKC